MTTITIRRIEPADVETVVELIHGLAEYDQESEECQLTAEQLHAALFAPKNVLYAHVAEADGEVVGCATWFLNFSTWRGIPGIYLEDLYVRPEQRRGGVGKALLTALAQESVRRGHRVLEWSVLDWNDPAISFYLSLGANPVKGRSKFRLADNALRELGKS